MTFTFENSFNSSGKEGNCFIFPGFSLKIGFEDDGQRLNLCGLNPKFHLWAEKGRSLDGGQSPLVKHL